MMYVSVRKVKVQTAEGKNSGSKTLLDETSLEINRGSIVGVYGPNGSGKSTLLRALCGVNPLFQSGEVWVDRVRITPSQRAHDRVQNIMYLASDFTSPFEVQVRDLLDLGQKFSEKPQNAVELVRELKLEPFLKRVVSTLSEGEKQWVMFARALIQNPHVLVLDESFSKLDLDRLLQAGMILKKQAQSGMTFVLSSHDLNFLSEVSDDLILMNRGAVVARGGVAEVLTLDALRGLYPDVNGEIVRSLSGRVKLIY